MKRKRKKIIRYWTVIMAATGGVTPPPTSDSLVTLSGLNITTLSGNQLVTQ